MKLFGLLSDCPIIRKRDRIQKWIDAIEPTPEATPESATEPDLVDPGGGEPPRKRLRRFVEACISANPDVAANTNVDRSDHPDRFEQDAHDSGCTSSTPLPYTIYSRRKPWTVIPIKDRDDLGNLAKPVCLSAPWSREDSPDDVRSLHQEIFNITHYLEPAVPKELRQQVLELHRGELIPERVFCSSECTEGAMDAVEAETMLRTIRSIARRTGESEILERGEPGWHHLVHTPLLELAFGSEVRHHRASSNRDEGEPAARFEPIMSATIMKDSIPQLRPRLSDTNNDRGPLLAWPVPPSTTSIGDDGDTAVSLSRENRGIVDYAVVLDIPPSMLLQKTINELIWRVSFCNKKPPRVNQTDYYSIQDHPIAVSILVVLEYGAIDPVANLGVWVAAWHKRMYFLRDWMLMLRGSITDLSQARHPRLVTVPLIVVTGPS
ncbi:hypothetical protein F5Y10DRAFT_285536 [Nemania abortiva]|nr:hypothetical protein F5Y10DRAFT_285536 [Nemania abortiva]